MPINNISHLTWLLLLSIFTLISCGQSEANKEAKAAIEAPAKPDPNRKIVEVTYESATVYTGQTNYYFKTERGIRVEIGISNMEEDQKAKTPADLLEKGVEGPPGANPEKVGKAYELIYEKGQVVEIREKKQ